jgi:hypothetical protein
MPRWCRIHLLLFAAQLDGLKITTSSNNNKKKNPPKQFPSVQPKAVFLFRLLLLCVKERNWSTLSRDRKGAEADHWRQVNRFLGFCRMTKFVLTTSPPTEPKLAVLMGNNHETNVSLGSCPRALHSHTKQLNTRHTHKTIFAIQFLSQSFTKTFLLF